MDMAGFDVVCGQMDAAERVIQWKGSHVWKIGGRMFAVSWSGAAVFACSIKATEMARQVFAGQEGIIPAPYLARAGWLQITDGALPDAEIADLIRVSHALVMAGLPGKRRAALHLR